MKWICDHRSESQFKQMRKIARKKSFSGNSNEMSSGSNPVEISGYFSQLLKLRFIAMVTYSFHSVVNVRYELPPNNSRVLILAALLAPKLEAEGRIAWRWTTWIEREALWTREEGEGSLPSHRALRSPFRMREVNFYSQTLPQNFFGRFLHESIKRKDALL